LRGDKNRHCKHSGLNVLSFISLVSPLFAPSKIRQLLHQIAGFRQISVQS
jgi:hypothetical protein